MTIENQTTNSYEAADMASASAEGFRSGYQAGYEAALNTFVQLTPAYEFDTHPKLNELVVLITDVPEGATLYMKG